MKFLFPLRTLLLCLILAAGLFRSNAQWVTQTVQVTNGWNAVFLHVDASYNSISNLVATDASNPITQIWRWNPSLRTQFVNSPATPTATLDWLCWNRTNSSVTTLQNLVGDSAYLVYVSSATNVNYKWQVKGQPVPPRHTWTVSGLNLIGFPVVSNAPPTFASFFGQSQALQTVSPEVDYYVGGELVAGTNPKLLSSALFTLTSMARGQAYWMRSGTVFNNYFGPFEVVSVASGGINYGSSLGQSVFRLNNLSTNSLTITATLSASDTPPAGQPALAGVPPLLIKGSLNTTNLTYGYSVLSTSQNYSWTLAPYGTSGSSLAVTLGLDRSAITNPQGSILAGIITFTDSLGFMQVPIPVQAQVGSLGGLWVGNASVSQVGEYLKTYASNSVSTLASAVASAGLGAPNSELSSAVWLNAQGIPLINPSFQTDTVTVFPGYTNLTGWTATGLTGINPGTAGGVSFSPYADNGIIPIGTQTAFLQGSNVLSQVVSNLQVGGVYQVHYFENAEAAVTNNNTRVPGWKLKVVVGNGTLAAGTVGTVAQAEALLANTNSGVQSTLFSTNAAVLNYTNNAGLSGQFANDANFPGLGSATTNWVLEATAQITIPTNGTYSFHVNSDEGFRFTLGTNVAVCDLNKTADDRITVFTNMVAGVYPIRLVYWQRVGPASLEFSANYGTNTTFSAAAFKLIGDTANGGLAVTNAGYLTSRVIIGTAANVGQMIVPAHTVLPVAAAGTFSTPYTEVWSMPFVASNSTMTLSFITASNSPSDFGVVLLDGVGLAPVLTCNYSAVASSADGSRIFAADAGTNSTGGQIYVSSNYGQTWSSVATNNPSGTVTNKPWSALACSSSGKVVLAAVTNGPLYLSSDYGAHWATTAASYGSNTWTTISVSQDGIVFYAITAVGVILRSPDAGVTWAATRPTSNTNESWGALVQSANASNVLAFINDGRAYKSSDMGVTWNSAGGGGRSTVAAAADATLTTLVTVSTNGQISISQSSGMAFSTSTLSIPGAKVACSMDGLHIVAAGPGSPIYTSDDTGNTWNNRSLASQWSGVASSGDGTRLAVVASTLGSTNAAIYTLSRQFNVYSIDAASGVIMLPSTGTYLSTLNTNLGAVPAAYPLRLIIQNPTNGSPAVLMQRVYAGLDAYTNSIISSGESALNAKFLTQARRISAVHLPWTPTNTLWSFNGALARGSTLSTTVFVDYNDRAANPFVHAYHPDHNNLNATFSTMLARGSQSYDLQRKITLYFQGTADDFASRIGAATALSGTYTETFNVLGLGSNSRSFQSAGTFQLNRMTDNANLTVAP